MDVNKLNGNQLFMPKKVEERSSRTSHKPKPRDSIEYKNLHKDVINIAERKILSQFIDSSALSTRKTLLS